MEQNEQQQQQEDSNNTQQQQQQDSKPQHHLLDPPADKVSSHCIRHTEGAVGPAAKDSLNPAA